MIRGKVWKFADDIDTDAIIPGRYLDDYSPSSLAKHVMEGVDPAFALKVSKGDIIIAGKNFGIGSSREQAATALLAAGVEVILAESFARIFYRNAVNQGMLPLICKGGAESFENGDQIVIDVEKSTAYRASDPKEAVELERMSPYISRIHSAGGLVKLTRSELSATVGDGKDK